MKKIIFSLLSILISFQQIRSQCPIGGDKQNAKFQHLDSLKNRTIPFSEYTILNLADILKPGNDEKRYNTNQFVKIIGYVYLVKFGGGETCNCHTTDKTQLDIHIELVLDMTTGSNTKAMIIEINRFTRNLNKSMDYDAIKLLKGKKVELTGWLFFDEEHKHNAINTNPQGTNLWRATCWEVHPCLSIKEIK